MDTMDIPAPRLDRELVSTPQRVAEPIFSVITVTLLCGFFAAHQLSNTGFFTEQFGPAEMLCLYGPILLTFTAPFMRALTGRRNPGRPLEAVASVCAALAALWLLHVFPFDFTHFADVFPGQMQFMFAWVSDGIGKIILALQVVIGLISALALMVAFVLHSLRASFGRTHA
jgi:hypothetical protein